MNPKCDKCGQGFQEYLANGGCCLLHLEGCKELDCGWQTKHDIITPDNTYPEPPPETGVSDGSTASYYELPPGATQLQHLISYKNMNAQIGEIFRAAYRNGESSHSDQLRDARKIQFYINAEIERLEQYGDKIRSET